MREQHLFKSNKITVSSHESIHLFNFFLIVYTYVYMVHCDQSPPDIALPLLILTGIARFM